MKTAATISSIALLLLVTACPGNERSDMPTPDNPATGAPGVDTVPPSPPAPGNQTGNAAPINNDESAEQAGPGDNSKKQGASSQPGAASATTR